MQLSHFHNFSIILSFIHFFKMSNSIVEFFCSLCYIQCVERFHDNDVHDGLDYLTYEFTSNKDIYNGFADREMGCIDHIDYFLLYLMDDDQIVRKYCAKLSDGYIVILSSRLSVSNYLSVLHYQSFLGTSQFTPLVILHPRSFYSLSNSTLLAILHTQSLYSVSHFIHSVILHCKPFYILSNITQSVILHPQSCYIVSQFTPSVILHLKPFYTLSFYILSHSTLSVIL
jgi:hypothetical protein